MTSTSGVHSSHLEEALTIEAMMNSSDEHTIIVNPTPYIAPDISSQYSGIGRVPVDPVFVSSIQCVVLL